MKAHCVSRATSTQARSVSPSTTCPVGLQGLLARIAFSPSVRIASWTRAGWTLVASSVFVVVTSGAPFLAVRSSAAERHRSRGSDAPKGGCRGGGCTALAHFLWRSQRASPRAERGPMTIIDERSVLCQVIDEVEQRPAVRLDLAEPEWGSAVYVLTVGSGVLTGGLAHLELLQNHHCRTGWPLYVGSAADVRARRRRYLSTLTTVRTLGAADLEIAILPTDSHEMALYFEQLLINVYEPLLNQPWMSGLGSSRNQGRARRQQRQSAFATMFGRRGGGIGTAPPRHSYEELVERADQHLARTVGETRWLRRGAER